MNTPRETFTTLRTTIQDYISSTSTTVQTFTDRELNKAIRFIKAELRKYNLQEPPEPFTTVPSTQYYSLPGNFHKLEAASLTNGTIKYPLVPVNSANEWNRINQITFSGTTIPQYIFIRKFDFGIWPIPQSVMTGGLIYDHIDKDLDTADYTTSTVSVTNGSVTVTGLSVVWTDDFVGRWFRVDTHGVWYRIEARSGNILTLHRKYEGVTGTALAYTIGESPDLPSELHEYVPHKVAAAFYAGPRKDYAAAQNHLNYFWTGDFNNSDRSLKNKKAGLLGAINRYSGSDNSAIVYRGLHQARHRFDERWSTTLSGA